MIGLVLLRGHVSFYSRDGVLPLAVMIAEGNLFAISVGVWGVLDEPVSVDADRHADGGCLHPVPMVEGDLGYI